MDEQDFIDLIAYWQTQGVRPNHQLASDDEIREWECKHKVLLPTDLRQYVMRVNGIQDGDKLEFGNDLFSFLSLSAMHPESDEVGAGRPGMFVFVDYCITSYWFCVELDDLSNEKTRVFLGGTGDHRDRLVATSLHEFFRLYRERLEALQF